MAIEWIKDQVDGIVDAFYPGENGGQAIADVLFGDYNPGGTLYNPQLHTFVSCVCVCVWSRMCGQRD